MAQSSAQQTLRRLTVIVGLQWMGATLGLPLLPLFLEHRDGTPSVDRTRHGVVLRGGYRHAVRLWPPGRQVRSPTSPGTQSHHLRTREHDLSLAHLCAVVCSHALRPRRLGRSDRGRVHVGGGVALSRSATRAGRCHGSSPPSSSGSPSDRSSGWPPRCTTSAGRSSRPAS